MYNEQFVLQKMRSLLERFYTSAIIVLLSRQMKIYAQHNLHAKFTRSKRQRLSHLQHCYIHQGPRIDCWTSF